MALTGAVAPNGKDYDNLTLDLTAKTYRYLDEEELAAADAQKGMAVSVTPVIINEAKRRICKYFSKN